MRAPGTIDAEDIVGAAEPVVSVSPVVLPAPERGEDLRVRVSAPQSGEDLPIVLFAHGYGSSLRAYGPLVDFWAAHGFVVVQPTFVDSRTSALSSERSDVASWWRSRVADMDRILDDLDAIEAAVPGLTGRLDRNRVGVAGHSFGGQTAGVLLGLRVGDAAGEQGPDLSDPRVTVGVLFATAGEGGDALRPGVAEQLPWLVNPSFADLTTPTLVFSGDQDINPLTTRGADWGVDPYRLSPGAESLVTLFGGEHSLGGIAGYEAKETTDENAARVAAIQQLSWAFLRSRLYPGDPAWEKATIAFAENSTELGRLESK